MVAWKNIFSRSQKKKVEKEFAPIDFPDKPDTIPEEYNPPDLPHEPAEPAEPPEPTEPKESSGD